MIEGSHACNRLSSLHVRCMSTTAIFMNAPFAFIVYISPMRFRDLYGFGHNHLIYASSSFLSIFGNLRFDVSTLILLSHTHPHWCLCVLLSFISGSRPTLTTYTTRFFNFLFFKYISMLLRLVKHFSYSMAGSKF